MGISKKDRREIALKNTVLYFVRLYNKSRCEDVKQKLTTALHDYTNYLFNKGQ